ncbi:MAG TPA: exonuclease domain-containing protein [Mycobacteriales bacterium]|nr:exonuclease domain-containing protein [Mycobacteriales bacterium]
MAAGAGADAPPGPGLDRVTTIPDPSGDGLGFSVLDVETTGLVPARDRIVEIGVVRTDRTGRVIDEWSSLVNPSGPVGATQIHGITAADVRRAPTFAELAGELTARLAGRALVAHNAEFDLNFLRMEYTRTGVDMPVVPWLCTLRASWDYLPHLSRRRLPDCCYACRVRLDDAHSALGDARATAGLLAAYLDPDIAGAPMPEHAGLPARAAVVDWPAVPRTPVTVVTRQSRAVLPPAAAPGRLVALVEDLPLGAAEDDGAPAEAGPYLELLAEVLDDGVLTEAEADGLVEVATLYSLSRGQVLATHRGLLLALARRAVEDGTVTRDERAELTEMATLLGLDLTVVRALLDEARDTRIAELSRGLTPLPDDWPYGEPLRVGQRVVFTGCDERQRARLEGAAKAAGLKVTGAVSRQTSVLVTDGADPFTTKAVAARQLGTRVVAPTIFARMLTYIQPPRPADSRTGEPAGGREPARVATARTSVPSLAVAGPAVSRVLPDPADIRDWARARGLPTGTRGRLPAHLVDAYHLAHQPVG